MKRGLPLGCRNLAPEIEEHVLKLESGALLVFYTDGLVEGRLDLLSGEQQLADALGRREIRESDDVARAVRNAMLPSETVDDVAILVIRAL